MTSRLRSQPDDVMFLAAFAKDEQLPANRVGARQPSTLIRRAHVVHIHAAALHQPRGFALRDVNFTVASNPSAPCLRGKRQLAGRRILEHHQNVPDVGVGDVVAEEHRRRTLGATDLLVAVDERGDLPGERPLRLALFRARSASRARTPRSPRAAGT